MNNNLYKEEALWQAFCRELGLPQSDDVDDYDPDGLLWEQFIKDNAPEHKIIYK